MTHQQAADPAALEVLLDGEGQFGAAPRGGDGAADEIARPADDDLVLARADGYQKRDRPLEIRPRDPTEFGVTDIGFVTKEPRVERVPLEIEEGAADLRSVIGTGRAYRHRGAVPQRLCEDIARVPHASPPGLMILARHSADRRSFAPRPPRRAARAASGLARGVKLGTYSSLATEPANAIRRTSICQSLSRRPVGAGPGPGPAVQLVAHGRNSLASRRMRSRLRTAVMK